MRKLIIKIVFIGIRKIALHIIHVTFGHVCLVYCRSQQTFFTKGQKTMRTDDRGPDTLFSRSVVYNLFKMR